METAGEGDTEGPLVSPLSGPFSSPLTRYIVPLNVTQTEKSPKTVGGNDPGISALFQATGTGVGGGGGGCLKGQWGELVVSVFHLVSSAFHSH